LDRPLPACTLRPSSTSFATKWALPRYSGVAAGENPLMDGKSMVIGALVIGVAVLGYLYWDSRENTLVKLPGVEIKKN
jgi:hypothetical protein